MLERISMKPQSSLAMVKVLSKPMPWQVQNASDLHPPKATKKGRAADRSSLKFKVFP
jgi:hypothetical protein